MIETWFNQDVKKAVKVQYLDGNVFSQDNNGNKVGVCLYDGENTVNVSGSVSANVIRSDGATVAVTGDSSGNQAWVVLPQSCYAVPGVISIVIKATDNSDVTTLCAVVANVYQSSTDSTVDPGTIIPSISTLIAEIDTAVASIPADYSSLWTSLAPAFSSSASYVSGQYVTYNGGLYRFTTAHSGSWSASDVVTVNIGGELSDVKNAINRTEGDIFLLSAPRKNLFDKRFIKSGGYYNASGAVASRVNCYYSEQYIPVDPNKTYSFSFVSGLQFCTYNANGEFIERVSKGSALNQSFGSGVYYIRISAYEKTFSNYMMVEGSTIPAQYTDYELEIKDSALSYNVFDQIDDLAPSEIRGIKGWTYYGTGYIASNGNIGSSNEYRIYYILADRDFDLWTDDNVYKTGDDCILAVYSGSTFSSSTFTGIYGRQQKNEQGTITNDTMPKVDSKAAITTGKYVAVSVKKACTDFRLIVSNDKGFNKYMNSEVILADSQLKQAKDFGRATISKDTDNVYVYIPTSNGKYLLEYKFSKVDDSTINAYGWRLYSLWICDLDKTRIDYISYSGEWEMAIKIKDSPDFIGLGNHGDEMQSMFRLYVDGREITQTGAFDERNFNKLQLICKLTMYDPSNHTTVVGYHTRIETIDSEKKTLTIENKVDFVRSYVFEYGYLFMASLAKDDYSYLVTDTFIDDEDFVLTNCSTATFDPPAEENGVGKTKHKSTEYKFWGSGLETFGYAKITKRIAPEGVTQANHIYGGGYNKIYYSICSVNDTAAAGDTWIMETEFFLDCGFDPT